MSEEPYAKRLGGVKRLLRGHNPLGWLYLTGCTITLSTKNTFGKRGGFFIGSSGDTVIIIWEEKEKKGVSMEYRKPG